MRLLWNWFKGDKGECKEKHMDNLRQKDLEIGWWGTDDGHFTRLYEMQKVPKKIAPKNWAYLTKQDTCLVSKIWFKTFFYRGVAFLDNGLWKI